MGGAGKSSACDRAEGIKIFTLKIRSIGGGEKVLLDRICKLWKIILLRNAIKQNISLLVYFYVEGIGGRLRVEEKKVLLDRIRKLWKIMENDFYVKNRGRRGLSSYTPFTSTGMADTLIKDMMAVTDMRTQLKDYVASTDKNTPST